MWVCAPVTLTPASVCCATPVRACPGDVGLSAAGVCLLPRLPTLPSHDTVVAAATAACRGRYLTPALRWWLWRQATSTRWGSFTALRCALGGEVCLIVWSSLCVRAASPVPVVPWRVRVHALPAAASARARARACVWGGWSPLRTSHACQVLIPSIPPPSRVHLLRFPLHRPVAAWALARLPLHCPPFTPSHAPTSTTTASTTTAPPPHHHCPHHHHHCPHHHHHHCHHQHHHHCPHHHGPHHHCPHHHCHHHHCRHHHCHYVTHARMH
jgi:hypothetical protein